MVDALGRTRQWLAPGGHVIDLHPTPEPGRLEIQTATGVVTVGDLQDDGSAKGPFGRHANADRAVAAAIAHGWFALDERRTFTFLSHGDTLGDLQRHMAAKWRDTHINGQTFVRAMALLHAHPGATPRLREQVTIARLRRLR